MSNLSWARLDIELMRRNLTRFELCNLSGIDPVTLRRVIEGRPCNLLTWHQIEAVLSAHPVVALNGSRPTNWSWRDSPRDAAIARRRRARIREQARKAQREAVRQLLIVKRRDRYRRRAHSAEEREKDRQRARRWYQDHRDQARAAMRARWLRVSRP